MSASSIRFDAVVYYPATAEGENAPFAIVAPFPLIAFAHGNRNIGVPACPGTPTDFSEDYRQMSTILGHLACGGYVVISSDQSQTILLSEKAEIPAASVHRMIAENEQNGSLFEGKIRTSRISLMGHHRRRRGN